MLQESQIAVIGIPGPGMGSVECRDFVYHLTGTPETDNTLTNDREVGWMWGFLRDVRGVIVVHGSGSPGFPMRGGAVRTAVLRRTGAGRARHGTLIVLSLLLAWSAAARCDDLPWAVTQTSGEPQVSEQRLEEDGRPFQRFRCAGDGSAAYVEFSAGAPLSLLHDEFRATLRLRTNVQGIRFGLRILLPDQIDPRTDKPLETILRGSVSGDSDDWQTLVVTGSRNDLESHLRRVRAELHRSDVASRNAVATGLALLVELSPGETFVDVGSFEFGPVIAPPEALTLPVSMNRQSAAPAAPQFVPLAVELNRIMLGGKPVILRVAPDHGESLEDLQRLGLNAVWVQDYRAAERAAELQNLGLAVLATPPHPEFEPGDFSRLLRALPPLDQLCPTTSAWYTGTRVPPAQLPHLLALSREVRSADRTLQRPLMADVIGAEGAAAREIDLIGIGRHVVGRTESFGELRNELFRRRRLAGQLAFPWTWIQTEPSGIQQWYREPSGLLMPVVEPEQIMLQLHAAISAGCKGIGFWKTHGLDANDPADREMLLGIELAGLYLTMLEPFLADGRVDGHLPILNPLSERFGSSRSGANSQMPLQMALNGQRPAGTTTSGERPSGPDAASVSAGSTRVILLTHWDDESQFVPTPMFQSQAQLVVAASETASAWRVSAAGVEGLPREITAGGLSVRISDLDQHCVIVVSSDPEMIRELTSRILTAAPRNAALTFELAELKRSRVHRTLEAISREVTPPGSASMLLTRADQAVVQAGKALKANAWQEAMAGTERAMRLLRECQYLCWRQAVDTLDGPTASPHTISFATLPDHWRMMNQLRRRRPQESSNLVVSGSFENQRLLADGVWKRDPLEEPDWLTTADVIREPTAENSVLRLAAWPSSRNGVSPAAPGGQDARLVVRSPPVQVAAGDIIRVTGRLRLGRSITPGSERPVRLFDSVLGPEHAIRPDFVSGVGRAADEAEASGKSRMVLRDRYRRDWVEFEFFREATEAGPFQLAVALTAAVEIHLDDVSITALPATADPELAGPFRTAGDTSP